MIDVWHKYVSDGRNVFYRIEGNVKDGFISMATLEGGTPSDKVQSKEPPTRADVEEQVASYVRGTKNQA
jgi:hypothetical protein